MAAPRRLALAAALLAAASAPSAAAAAAAAAAVAEEPQGRAAMLRGAAQRSSAPPAARGVLPSPLDRHGASAAAGVGLGGAPDLAAAAPRAEGPAAAEPAAPPPPGDDHAGAAARANLTAAASLAGGRCLCLFDIDRTLTAKQGSAGRCPGDRAVRGVRDSAYGGGQLVLSQLAQHLGSTPCGRCRLGAVSAGSGGSGAERSMLRRLLRGGPVVLGCQGWRKPSCARRLAGRYGVPLRDVYFFDDKRSNVLAFRGSGMNAHEVSCASRSGSIGYCGAKSWEIHLTQGVSACR